MLLRPLCLLLLFFVSFSLVGQSIRINEVASSNSTLRDEDGDTPDWFELRNFSNEDLELTGWTVSDDASQLGLWAFPSYIIPANGYLKIWASDKDRAAISTPRTLITQGDAFRYLLPTQPVPPAWRTFEFDDSSWPQGASGFGYGDGDDVTQLPEGTRSVFLRKTFMIDDPVAVTNLFLDMDFDDGFVAYLNGTEIARFNMSSNLGYIAFASDLHEALIPNGEQPRRFEIENFAELLQAGENLLCVQVHNASATSSDFSAVPFLTALFDGPSEQGIEVPAVLSTFTTSCFHTNFRLSTSGETIYLHDAEGNFKDSIALSEQQSGVSYGIPVNAPNTYAYFPTPTPAAANTGSNYEGVITSQVEFSHQGGITEPLTLTLSGAGEGEEIRFTLDATEPTINSVRATQPITINSTRVVRAKIFRPGYLAGQSSSRSYLIGVEHDLPVVSLITEPNNFFHPDTGMYVLGTGYSGDFPFFGSNIWEDWERPLHFSLYEEDGSLGTELNVGVRLFGNYSRAQPQRSLSLFARGIYGQNAINYPLFSDRPYQSYQSVVLRNSGSDFLNTTLRDATLSGLMASVDLETQAYRPTVAYLNGQYWGIHNLREKINEHFLADKFNLDPDAIDILEFDGQIVQGDNTDYNAMVATVAANGVINPDNYAAVLEQIDVDNFALYFATQIYINNTDWPGNNIKFWRPENGKWRWILFDTDFGFGIWNENDYSFNTINFALEQNGPGWPNPPWSTALFRRMIENLNFRNKFINRLADEMNSRFLPARVVQHINNNAGRIASEIPAHYSRWGGDANYQAAQVQRMRNFANQRPSFVKSHVRNRFSLAAVRRIFINNPDHQRGYVEVNNNLHIQQPQWGGDYFQGVPITLRAVAEPGYVFSHWEQESNSTEAEIELDLTSTTQIKPVFVAAPFVVNDLVINEINYRSAIDFDTGDWIELYNNGSNNLDISNWIFRDDDDTHAFVFPEGTVMAPGSFFLLVRDLALFQAAYPDLPNVIGEFDFGLSSNGDEVRIYNEALELQDSVAYLNEAPWPTAANGQGPTLELLDPGLDNELPQSWAQLSDFGSPGRPNNPTNLTEFTGQGIVPLTISPNPSSGKLIINLELNTSARVQFSVYDAWGANVFSAPAKELPAGEQRLQTELSSLPAGTYFVRVLVNQIPQGVERWVKQ